jgi:RNA polymerase sigma-70 factor (ECF subfamily)
LLESPLHNESVLLGKIAEGDELAFNQLFNNYRKRVYSIAFKFSQSPDIAEEILQDIFLKIWLSRFSLTEIQNFSAYLYVITKNETFHALKRIARNKNALENIIKEKHTADNSTDHKVLERDYNQLLQNALGRLSPQQKLVYQLIKEQGLTREEASAQLCIHPETVKTHLAQAMKNIRAYCLSILNNVLVAILTFLIS